MSVIHLTGKEAKMTVELEASAVRLDAGQTLRVRDAAGETICCREGSVWITEERNPRRAT
jgi:hypothetical protein